MANIKTLTISIAANISDFTKGLNKARRDLNKWAKDIPGATMGVGTAFAASATAAAAGLAYMTREALKAIDVSVKLADRLAISTEFLASLQHAAGLAGVSSEQLTVGLERMVKSLPAGANVGESFKQIAKDIASIKDPVLQAQAAVAVFGKSGQSMLPLITSNLESAREEAQRLGITFTRSQGAMVEAANDAMSKVYSVTTGVFQQVAINVAPFITAISDYLVEVATSGEDMGSRVSKAFEFVARGVGKTLDFLELFKVGFYSLRGVVQTVSGFWVDAMSLALKGIAGQIQITLIEPLRVINKVVGNDTLKGLIDGFDQAKFAAQYFLEDLSKGLKKDADESFAAGQKALEAFTSGENESKAMRMFTSIQQKAKDVADGIAEKAREKLEANTGVAGLGDFLKMLETDSAPAKAAKRARASEFKQIDTSLIKLGGPTGQGGEQVVKDPQLNTTNKVLQQIYKAISAPSATVPVAG